MADSDQNTPIANRLRYAEASPIDGLYSSPSAATWDSGYGSQSTTPEQTSVPRRLPDFSTFALDGNSPDIPNPFHDKDEDDLIFFTPTKSTGKVAAAKTKAKPSSIPRPKHGHFRSSLSSAYFSTPSTKSAPRRRLDVQLSTPRAVSSLRLPDRFVHPRDTSGSPLRLSDRFHLTKLPGDLSASEKINRHSHYSLDVFAPEPTRDNVATNTETRPTLQQETGIAPQVRTRTTLGSIDHNSELEVASDRPSDGSVWSIGAISLVTGAVENGRGQLLQSGTNAPFYTSSFINNLRPSEEPQKHSGRLAAALDVDLATRLLHCNIEDTKTPKWQGKKAKTLWNGSCWQRESPFTQPVPPKADGPSKSRPLRILSAPNLRDDFYCSVLAFSPTSKTLAVGLGDYVYSWTEEDGARLLNGSSDMGVWVTSLAFSSTQGGKSILAFGRSNNMLGLTSMYEAGMSRMVIQESSPITCLCWRPTTTKRPSKNQRKERALVDTEDLLVGDDAGNVLYYVLEWPSTEEMDQDNWKGEMTLVSRISVHYQQICGLAWSLNGQYFATGGNDNMCCLFEADEVLPRYCRPGGTGVVSIGQPRGQSLLHSEGSHLTAVLSGDRQVRERVVSDILARRLGPGSESWRWEHGAAVKAIAFCPWQDGLVATGGGSNDKCIHFFHTTSGSALATIFVSSQVTSLVWSTTRREIAATFGFVHPGHAVRIAVYAWPSCKQVRTIEWDSEHRALYGISCAKGPYYQPEEADTIEPKDQEVTLKEGCISVAASDGSIKFYDLWPSDNKLVVGGVGMLGGSDILEDLEGIQKEGDIIR